MSLQPTHWSPSATHQKLSRYTIVTLIATPANFMLFTMLLTVVQLPAVAANLVAAACITIPTYVAYRRWVWPADDVASTASEVGAYWLWTAASVALASGVLWLLEGSGGSRPILVVAPLLTYAALWVARFSFLDRYLFAEAEAEAEAVSTDRSDADLDASIHSQRRVR